MRKAVALAIALVTALVSENRTVLSSEPITVNHHQITVIDGDTVEIGKTVYQLAGIDAPELGQACDHGGHLWLCGLAAGYSLRKQLELQSLPIHCFVQERLDALPLAACMIGDTEVSVNMLQAGHVLAVPGAPPHYAAAEHMARQGGLGIWGSEVIPPWDWRNGKRLENEHMFRESSHPTDELPWKDIEGKFLHLESDHAACMIKGVITAGKERLYYGPLDHKYPGLGIDTGKGERYFCGDEDARNAGWRREGELAGSGQ